MKRLESIKDFENYKKSLKQNSGSYETTVIICAGTGCAALGSEPLTDTFRKEIQRAGLDHDVLVKNSGCHGFCERGPVVVIHPYHIFYPNLTPKDIPLIVEETLKKGNVVERLLYVDSVTGKRISHVDEIPFYKNQMRLVLRQNGLIDPTDINDYILNSGYEALVKALKSMSPEEVIDSVEKSGLRGRGGAGFSTGLKWRLCRKSPGDLKYLVCNADEGDPGAFMDRSVLEGNPHLVLEGMIIAAYAIGAREAYVYVRAEYPLAIKHLTLAISQAEELGLLGDGILGGGTSLKVKIKEGAGAFVCGEETALIASIEGKRGMPRVRPPYPAVSGLWGKPTNINNVETFANVPNIILKGHEWYASIGTEKSKGTKIFSLTGKINNTGLVEVPMGITLKEIVFDIGGGIQRQGKFKAALTGGPSGGCIPPHYPDLPIDYESLSSVGAIMGSGGLIVMDETTCIVDIAKYFMSFTQSESCGKCVPCRVGTKRMLEILTRITEGNGRMEDLDILEDMARTIKDSSLCGLGQTAPNPVLSTIRYFRDEYVEHILDKKCRAAACEALVFTPCHHTCPAQTDVEGYILLINEKRFNEATAVIMDTNPFPQTIGRICLHPCESRCRRAKLDRPITICSLKRFAADISNFEEVKRYLPRLNHLPQTGTKIAVLGAGPGGLTAAFYLARLGYRPVVFEVLPVAGGMMRVGIPEYRLPREVLDAEIERIKSFGVDIRLNADLGGAGVFDRLFKEGFKAILLATGTHGDIKLGMPGEDVEGVHSGIRFLWEIKLGEPQKLGERVAVIGGGNVAIDAARSALRLGAKEVRILYRRTRDEMPASPWEIEAAEYEGVETDYLIAPVSIKGKRKVQGIRCIRMKLGDVDDSGRRRPVPIENSEFIVKCDTIITAIGQVPGMKFGTDENVEIRRNGTIVVDRNTLAASRHGVYACGDAVTGPASAIEAIAAGKKAAASIHKFCGGKAQDLDLLGPIVNIIRTPPEVEEGEPVAEEPMLAREKGIERIKDFREVEITLSPDEAFREAKRCLRCSLG